MERKRQGDEFDEIDGEELFETDFEFSDQQKLTFSKSISASSSTVPLKPPIIPGNVQRKKNEKEIVLVRLSDLAQFGITINEIQESGMKFDTKGNKWVMADEVVSEGGAPEEIDLTGFDSSLQSEAGWDDEFGFQDEAPPTPITKQPALKLNDDPIAAPATVAEADEDDDLDGFDDFEDHGEPIKLKCDDLQKDSLAPKSLQIIKLPLQKQQELSESYDCDFDDDDNTSHDLSILCPPVNKSVPDTATDNESKVSDFLKTIRLNPSNQAGPRLIRPEDVASLLQNVKQKPPSTTPEIMTLPSRTNMTISTLSDTLDDFDDLLLDDLPSHPTVTSADDSKKNPKSSAQMAHLTLPVNRGAGTASVGGSTHEDTLSVSDRETTGNPDEVENWDDGFDLADEVLSIHTIKAMAAPQVTPLVEAKPLALSLPVDGKKGKKGHSKKMKLFTPADMENQGKGISKYKATGAGVAPVTQDSTSPHLLMKFDSQLQKWVNNDGIVPAEEVDWDDQDEVLTSRSSSSRVGTPKKNLSNCNNSGFKKIDLGQYVDSSEDFDFADNSLKSHSGSLADTQERERISSMADFHINGELAHRCQREHESAMLAFLGEEEYSRLMAHGPGTLKSNQRHLPEKSPLSQRKGESGKEGQQRLGPGLGHQRKHSRDAAQAQEEEKIVSPSDMTGERNKRRKTPPRIRITPLRSSNPSFPTSTNAATAIVPGPLEGTEGPSLKVNAGATSAALKSNHPTSGSGSSNQVTSLGTRKRKVLQDIWKVPISCLSLRSHVFLVSYTMGDSLLKQLILSLQSHLDLLFLPLLLNKQALSLPLSPAPSLILTSS
jgi:hypothetical protein